jgi:hypothetical protein
MAESQNSSELDTSTSASTKVSESGFLKSLVEKVKNRTTLLFAAITIGLFALGSTLAANISLNTGGNVEFGQGVLSTTACDDQVTITPYSTFINANNAGTHKLTSIKISGIDSREGHCSGKIFEIRVYDESSLLDVVNYNETDNYNDPPVTIHNDNYNFVEVTNTAGVFTWTSGGTDGDDVANDADVNDPGRNLESTSFTISFTSRANQIVRTPLANASDIINITVQTRDPE